MVSAELPLISRTYLTWLPRRRGINDGDILELVLAVHVDGVDSAESRSQRRSERGGEGQRSPESIAASLKPEEDGLVIESTTEVGVLPVDVGLLGREEMKIVCAEETREKRFSEVRKATLRRSSSSHS